MLSAAGSVDVDKVDIGDVDLARILGAGGIVDVEVALVQNDRSICVFDVNVLVGDVVDVAEANIWASPGLQARSVLTVQEGNIFNPSIGDVVLDARILTDGSHADTMRAITPQVLDVDVGCVWLGTEAVITNIDTSVCDSEAIHIERVESVSILGQGLESSVNAVWYRISHWEQLTEAFVETASMYTLSKTTFLVRTKKVVQHGESLRCNPFTSILVALSVKNKIGR